MITKVKRLGLILFCLIFSVGGLAPVFAGEGFLEAEAAYGNEIVWIMDRPQIWVYDEKYTGLGSYYTRVNGAQKVFKGEPYQYESTTYIPLRDICETFSIDVSYDNKDRSITLRSEDKCLILASTCLSDNGGYIIIEKDSSYNKVEEYPFYSLIEGMSYTSLQFLAEVFGWEINYEEAGSRIKVSGIVSIPDEETVWFSEEQKLFIEAAKNMESAKHITVSAFDGSEEIYTSTVTREFGKDGGRVEEKTFTTLTNGDRYSGLRVLLHKSGISRGVNKILPDGSKEGLDLGHAAMGNHTYNNVSMTFVEGIRKYEQMEIHTLSKTENETLFSISFTYWSSYGWDPFSIEVTIDPINKTITKYEHQGTTYYFTDYVL